MVQRLDDLDDEIEQLAEHDDVIAVLFKRDVSKKQLAKEMLIGLVLTYAIIRTIQWYQDNE